MATVAPPRVRPYRRYLTSVFHRRFVQASALSLLVCYVEAIVLGEKRSLLWSWFPLGPAGFRAGALYACCLNIFILNVSQLQMGPRSTASPAASFRHSVLRPGFLQVVGWYLWSAFWFSEIYTWSAPKSAQLVWVNYEPLRQRTTLNERPIYLRNVYFLLAFVQIARHVYRSLDNIPIASSRPTPQSPDQRTHKLEPILSQIQREGPTILVQSVTVAGVTAVLGPFVYAIFLRRYFWSIHMAFAKLLYSIPRSNANPEKYPPSNPFLMFRSFLTGLALLLLWESTSFLFRALLAQEPLKKGAPLSTESKDANGTLLSGLMAKKSTVKTFAFWELAYISQKLPERRKTIFADIERKEGPTWTQMLQASLAMIKSIETRIQDHQNPTVTKLTNTAAPPPQIESLPRLAPNVKPAENIFASSLPPSTRSQKFESTIGPIARSIGQSPGWSPNAKQRVKGLLEYSGQKALQVSAASDTAASTSFLPGPLQQYAIAFIRSPAGWPFRRTFPRVLSSVILSSPNAQTAPIVDAIDSITRMLVASLSEDLYGKVQATVPETVRTLTSAINAIESLIETMKPHWTDIHFEIRGAEVPEDVEIVLERLKMGLDELLSAFQLYLKDVGLTPKDHRAAIEAVRQKERTRLGKMARHMQIVEDSRKNKEAVEQQRQRIQEQQRANGSGPGGQQGGGRKRLEERDRGKDREILTGKPSSKVRGQSPNKEESSGSGQQKMLPPAETGTQFGGIASENVFMGQKARPEMEQVR